VIKVIKEAISKGFTQKRACTIFGIVPGNSASNYNATFAIEVMHIEVKPPGL
jgi:hypothetical protein